MAPPMWQVPWGVAQAGGLIRPVASHEMPRRFFGERGVGRSAEVRGERAARGETAARGREGQTRRAARNRRQGARARGFQIGKGVLEPHRIGVQRFIQQRVGVAILHDLAGIHHHRPVANIGHDRDVMGDHDHRQPQFPLQAAQPVQDLPLDDHIECCDRFVGHHQFRFQRQRQRNRRALAHPAGVLVREITQTAGIDPHHLKEFDCARLGRRLAHPAPVSENLDDLVFHAVDRIEGVHRGLWNEGDVAPAQRIHPGLGECYQILAVELHLTACDPGIVGDHPGQGPRHGGLAATGFTDESDDGTLRNLEPRLADRDHVDRADLVGYGKIADGEEAFHHLSVPASGRAGFHIRGK